MTAVEWAKDYLARSSPRPRDDGGGDVGAAGEHGSVMLGCQPAATPHFVISEPLSHGGLGVIV